MAHPENNEEYKGLTVNSGVEQPAIINPYLNRSRFSRRKLTAADYVEGIVKGNVTVLGQAVTLVESTHPEHQKVAQEVIEKCLPYSGKSIRIGISGVPGAGKSTSIDEFGIHVLERTGGRLAVLAIELTGIRGLKLKVFNGKEILTAFGAVLAASMILLGVKHVVSGLVAEVLLGLVVFFFATYGILNGFKDPLLVWGKDKFRNYLEK